MWIQFAYQWYHATISRSCLTRRISWRFKRVYAWCWNVHVWVLSFSASEVPQRVASRNRGRGKIRLCEVLWKQRVLSRGGRGAFCRGGAWVCIGPSSLRSPLSVAAATASATLALPVQRPACRAHVYRCSAWWCFNLCLAGYYALWRRRCGKSVICWLTDSPLHSDLCSDPSWWQLGDYHNVLISWLIDGEFCLRMCAVHRLKPEFRSSRLSGVGIMGRYITLQTLE